MRHPRTRAEQNARRGIKRGNILYGHGAPPGYVIGIREATDMQACVEFLQQHCFVATCLLCYGASSSTG